MADRRITDIQKFYFLLASLESKLGGVRTLETCSARVPWPRRGVYFFMEEGEHRSTSGSGTRIVRVGTHALKAGSKTKLWTRLSQHRGQERTRGGNHRGSIFRLIIGTALIARHGYEFPTWGEGNNAAAEVRANEFVLERKVSDVIGVMPFLWLAIVDEPGAESLRRDIERNAIALLSNFGKQAIDPPSAGWLGHSCNRERIRKSGLWNSNHVDECYDPAFLERMERLVTDMECSP
jgi:hypothetical protein